MERNLEGKFPQRFMHQSFKDFCMGGCFYLSAAKSLTRALFEKGFVHTVFYEDLYTYERNYVIRLMAKKELKKWKNYGRN